MEQTCFPHPHTTVWASPGARSDRDRSHNEEEQQVVKHFGEGALATLCKLSSPSVRDRVLVTKTLSLTRHQRTSNFKGTFEVIERKYTTTIRSSGHLARLPVPTPSQPGSEAPSEL